MNWIKLIISLIFVILGVFLLRYGKKCKQVREDLAAQAEFYSGETSDRWRYGKVCFILGVLLLAIMVILDLDMAGLVILILTIIVMYGFAFGMWRRYKVVFAYVKDGNLFLYGKKEWRSIPLKELGGIAPWPGNIAFTIVDDQNEKLFDVYARFENAQPFLNQLLEAIQSE